MDNLIDLTPLFYGGNRFSALGGLIDGSMRALKRKYMPDDALAEEFFSYAAEILADPDFAASRNWVQHGCTSVYDHSIQVAFAAFCVGAKLRRPVRLKELVRGALLHDYFGYDWHEKGGGHRLHGFLHPRRALRRASAKYDLTATEKGIILRHMWPLTFLPPLSREAWIVAAVDKACALNEIIEKYLSSSGIECRWRRLARTRA